MTTKKNEDSSSEAANSTTNQSNSQFFITDGGIANTNTNTNTTGTEYSTKLSQIPISKWNNQNILDWLNRKLPLIYKNYKENFINNQINGELLLDFNQACLDHLNIFDSHLKEQLLDEIALLKIRNEYEFIRRFKSQSPS